MPLEGAGKQDAVSPTGTAVGPPTASREFSAETMGELLLALRARAADHPESPGLIASWPGGPEARIPAARRKPRRPGHPLREVSVARPGVRVRGGWAVGGTTYRAVPTPAETVRSTLSLAVAEACKNVVTHAYADRRLPESLRSAPVLPTASPWCRSRTRAGA
jgi:hypothetical protein